MNKEDLYRLWAYDKEIKLWNDMTENNTEKNSAEVKKIISRLRKKAKDKRKELYKFIETVQDPYYRILLKCRCVDRKSWKEVAQVLGGTPDSHRMALERYISETL